jgi:DNA-binding LacI/PurR family transcriptional regulator
MTSMPARANSATLKRVAEVANVSTATVARVLNDDPRVAADTRSRVVDALQVTGYRPNAIASGLRRQRTLTVGHIVNATSPNPFYVGVAIGLQQEAARHGYQVILQNSQDAATETAGVEALLARRVDAIVFTTAQSAKNVALVVDAGVRVMQVERIAVADAPAVTVDNYVGARRAVQHLVDLGHKDIAYIGADPQLHNELWSRVEQQRLDGYLDVVEAAGLVPRMVLGDYDLPNDDGFHSLGSEYMRKLIGQGPVPTAVFAASDALAAGVLQAIHDVKLWVPQDVSVIGFDDTFAAHLCPPLTTVALPMLDLGREAFLNAIGADASERTELTSRLVMRQSTAAPRQTVSAPAAHLQPPPRH